MGTRRPHETRVASLCFLGLGLATLGAWGGAALGGASWSQAGAAAGLALPFAALGLKRVRRWARGGADLGGNRDGRSPRWSRSSIRSHA